MNSGKPAAAPIQERTPWPNRVLRLALWLGVLITGLLTIAHLLWIIATPKGFWIIPRPRIISAPDINKASSPFNDVSIPVTPGIPGQQARISPADLKGVQPGEHILIIDRMYFADNQPTIYRLTPISFVLSYPALFFALLAIAIYRRQTPNRSMQRTLPLRGPAADLHRWAAHA
jgi:hypothetical protein